MPAKKSLGQNFLASEAIANEIAGALVLSPGDLVFEIGPGRGALTIPLVRSGATVVAYEIDEALVGLLREKCANFPNLEIYHADIRSVNFDAAAGERGKAKYKIAGNIPYNLTSTILIDLARWKALAGAVIMVQREVGERILAKPGERNGGILSVFLQSYFIIERVIKVRPGSFTPPPKVESVVLKFSPDTSGRGPAAREAFLHFLKACFSHRRKQLRNVLAEFLGTQEAGEWERGGALSGIDFGMRPEELSLDSWFRLSAASERMKGARRE